MTQRWLTGDVIEMSRAHNDVRGASQTTDVMPDMTNAYVKC